MFGLDRALCRNRRRFLKGTLDLLGDRPGVRSIAKEYQDRDEPLDRNQDDPRPHRGRGRGAARLGERTGHPRDSRRARKLPEAGGGARRSIVGRSSPRKRCRQSWSIGSAITTRVLAHARAHRRRIRRREIVRPWRLISNRRRPFRHREGPTIALNLRASGPRPYAAAAPPIRSADPMLMASDRDHPRLPRRGGGDGAVRRDPLPRR